MSGGLNVNATEFRPPGAPAPSAPATQSKGVNVAAKPFTPGLAMETPEATAPPPPQPQSQQQQPQLQQSSPPSSAYRGSFGKQMDATLAGGNSPQMPQGHNPHNQSFGGSSHGSQHGQQQQQQQGGQSPQGQGGYQSNPGQQYPAGQGQGGQQLHNQQHGGQINSHQGHYNQQQGQQPQQQQQQQQGGQNPHNQSFGGSSHGSQQGQQQQQGGGQSPQGQGGYQNNPGQQYNHSPQGGPQGQYGGNASQPQQQGQGYNSGGNQGQYGGQGYNNNQQGQQQQQQQQHGQGQHGYNIQQGHNQGQGQGQGGYNQGQAPGSYVNNQQQGGGPQYHNQHQNNSQYQQQQQQQHQGQGQGQFNNHGGGNYNNQSQHNQGHQQQGPPQGYNQQQQQQQPGNQGGHDSQNYQQYPAGQGGQQQQGGSQSPQGQGQGGYQSNPGQQYNHSPYGGPQGQYGGNTSQPQQQQQQQQQGGQQPHQGQFNQIQHDAQHQGSQYNQQRTMQQPAPQQQHQQIPQPRQMQRPMPVPVTAGGGSLPTKPISTGAPPPTAGPSSNAPFVVLLTGVRGSGKSTQATKVAEAFHLMHLSSGDLARQALDPLVELDTALAGWLTSDGKIKEGSEYKGLILDRFVALSQFDVYYLGHILQRYNLRINLVIHLNLDPEVGSDRAKRRDDGEAYTSPVAPITQRPQRDGRRLIEQNLLAETNRALFEASGALRQVIVMTRSIEEVAAEVHGIVALGMSELPRKCVMLPRAQLEDGSTLVTDHLLFKEVKAGVHTVLGTPASKFDSFPGSQMTGQMTLAEWKKTERFLNNYFVTLKADGKRVLMVRWGERVFIMPGKFVCMYEMLPKNVPSVLLNTVRDEAKDGATPTQGPASKLHFVFDAEYVQQNKTKRWCYYLFDYLYFEGKKATKIPTFNQRYNLLNKIMDEGVAFSTVFVKQFVTLPNIAKILPGSFKDEENLPFEIDGLVFQHDGPYKVPQDNRIFKWKPREMCSVDFRLCNGSVLPPSAEDTDCTTKFELATIAMVDGIKDERPYLGGRHVLLADEDLVKKHNLANGTVVEAVRSKWSKESYTSGVVPHGRYRQAPPPPPPEDPNAIHEWELMRVRTDKAFPNAEEIADAIVKMKPWSLEELKRECARVPPPRR